MKRLWKNLISLIFVGPYPSRRRDRRRVQEFLARRNDPERELPKPAPWTTDDATEFRRFLGTVPGQRLLARARCIEYQNALAGCRESITTSHSAGRGAGFSDAINWLESLSRVTGDQVTGTEPVYSDASRPPESEPDPAELLSL